MIRKIRGLSFPAFLSLVSRRIRNWLSYHLHKTRVLFSTKGLPDKAFNATIRGTSSPEKLIQHFIRREKPYFLWKEEDLPQIIGIINSVFPNEVKDTIGIADKICEHKFAILGSGETCLGRDINWHRDFKCGFVWKSVFYRDIKKIDYDDNSDIKIPWELSRFHHLVTLGKAYLFTRDEKYTNEFVSQVSSWIDKNPLMLGVNWVNTMEVAIRAVNFIFGYYFFRRSAHISEKFWKAFFQSLLEHGKFIEQNLEIRYVRSNRVIVPLNSNHYMADIVGLVYLALLFPELKESRRWRKLGISELFNEILIQNNIDGVNYEFSISYHRLVTELSLSAVILCMNNQVCVPETVLKRLETMIGFIASYMKPDGRCPLLADADDGRLHILSKNDINDHRYLLTVGAILFKRQDFKALAGGFNEEALWLLGPKAYSDFQAISGNEFVPKSRAFEVSGFYVMRKSDLYMIITCNDNGIRGTGGSHSHNDCLSFELVAFNETFVTDSGTYTYTADLELRNSFRGTKAHNTVMIDEEEINRVPEEAFRLENDARPRVNIWISNDVFDFFEGEHFGYQRLENPVTHRRRIFFDKSNEFWALRDILEGTGKHKIDLYFHLSPKCSITEENNREAIVQNNGKRLLIHSANPKLDLETIDDFVSYSYGTLEKSRTLHYSCESDLPFSAMFLILPLRQHKSDLDLDTLAGLASRFGSFEKELSYQKEWNE